MFTTSPRRHGHIRSSGASLAGRRAPKFNTSPSIMNVETRLDPPYDTKGSVMPVIGSKPMVTPMLMTAWVNSNPPNPTHVNRPKGSLMRLLAHERTDQHDIKANHRQHPAKPQRFTMTAKIMSL